MTRGTSTAGRVADAGIGSTPEAAPTRDPLFERLASALRDVAPQPPAEIAPGHRLIEDLGFDSVALVKAVLAIEDAFGIELPQDRLHELRTSTVGDLAAIVTRSLA